MPQQMSGCSVPCLSRYCIAGPAHAPDRGDVPKLANVPAMLAKLLVSASREHACKKLHACEKVPHQSPTENILTPGSTGILDRRGALGDYIRENSNKQRKSSC